MSQEELENNHELDTKLTSMSTEPMNYWLGKFLLEVRTVNSKEYSPDSLYQLCCGLHRNLRDNRSGLNVFEDAEFTEFCGVLDRQLKALNRTWKYVEKKEAGVITIEMEETLRKNGSLGDHNPQVFLDTLVLSLWVKFCFEEWKRT